jgi:hypothetical protein
VRLAFRCVALTQELQKIKLKEERSRTLSSKFHDSLNGNKA